MGPLSFRLSQHAHDTADANGSEAKRFIAPA